MRFAARVHLALGGCTRACREYFFLLTLHDGTNICLVICGRLKVVDRLRAWDGRRRAGRGQLTTVVTDPMTTSATNGLMCSPRHGAKVYFALKYIHITKTLHSLDELDRNGRTLKTHVPALPTFDRSHLYKKSQQLIRSCAADAVLPGRLGTVDGKRHRSSDKRRPTYYLHVKAEGGAGVP
ncbi:hypothetical protein EVAR_24436_1 [Eumeta japonica]|uniref:Uncharacterized protein n=1 Tax=Eumeta variegata TaxID=151549 RepID=A0A4C1WWH2_EUMVA|nr:hypothetical protein EVAR_24436_1 [Eumeta japonica]